MKQDSSPNFINHYSKRDILMNFREFTLIFILHDC